MIKKGIGYKKIVDASMYFAETNIEGVFVASQSPLKLSVLEHTINLPREELIGCVNRLTNFNDELRAELEKAHNISKVRLKKIQRAKDNAQHPIKLCLDTINLLKTNNPKEIKLIWKVTLLLAKRLEP